MMWVRRGRDRDSALFPGSSHERLLSRRELCQEPCFCPHRAGFFGTIVEYGAERKISRHSVLGAAVSIGVPQGVSLKVK